MPDVPARLVPDFDHMTEPGMFYWAVEGQRIMFNCPCGCGATLGVVVCKGPPQSAHVWGWDGNVQRPTVTPSIMYMGGCRWHGYLTGGIFKSC